MTNCGDGFVPFQKIGRLSRDVVVTEKIDGTNGLIEISEYGAVRVGSRSQWIKPKAYGGPDNFGFAEWVHDQWSEIQKLGPGRHFGEWWGAGIQRGYGLTEKRFSLFNVKRWGDDAVRPSCCHVVPTLWTGDFDTSQIAVVMSRLALGGSVAAPGFMKPEGVVIYHAQSNVAFKKTFEKDDAGKGREPMSEIGSTP